MNAPRGRRISYVMQRSLSVQTPESIAFSHELAGLGSRFLALIVDMLIQIAIIGAILAGLLLISVHAPSAQHANTSTKFEQSLVVAFYAALVFVVFFGYFIVFEAFWNGQTPGKKLMGLRVVRDGGYAIDFGSAAVRNLIRVGEAFVGFYAVSAIVCLASPENKRLGDLAAGTVVVRDANVASLEALVAEAQAAPRSPMLTGQEHAVIGQFVARRNTLSPSVRAQIAARIASQIRSRVSSDLQRLDDEEMLVRLAGSN